VNYDKNAFVAGIAVGRQLKGWATERINSNGEVSANMSVESETIIVLNYGLALPVLNFASQSMTASAYLSKGEVKVDLGTIVPPVSGFGATPQMQIAQETMPTESMNITVLSPTLDGSISITADLEESE